MEIDGCLVRGFLYLGCRPRLTLGLVICSRMWHHVDGKIGRSIEMFFLSFVMAFVSFICQG